MKYWILGAAISVAGCTLDTDGDIYWAAPGASEEQIADLRESCSRWNAIANRQQYVAGQGARGTHVILFVPRSEIPREPKPGGFYDGARTVYISTGIVEHRLMAIMHEQGHALGLEHVDQYGIMNKHGVADWLTAADLEECRRAGACR